MQKIEILHAPETERPFLVIYKPKGLPSAPLNACDKDNALAQAVELFPQITGVHGRKEIEHGLLHRLDTSTDGLMLIAARQDFYDFLGLEQREGRFIKYYKAGCDFIPDNAKLLGGFPQELPSFTASKITLKSCFRPYGEGRKEVRPVTEHSGKAALSKLGTKKMYSTEISIVNQNSITGTVTAECCITEGYRHQVRCHLAWAGYPVKGDLLYNANCRNSTETDSILNFSAVKLSFEYPKGIQNVFQI